MRDRQQPDHRPGNYYVSIRDGDRYILAAGPFETHQQALDMVGRVNVLANKLDGRAVWYAFGTCRLEDGRPVRPGQLNQQLGL